MYKYAQKPPSSGSATDSTTGSDVANPGKAYNTALFATLSTSEWALFYLPKDLWHLVHLYARRREFLDALVSKYGEDMLQQAYELEVQLPGPLPVSMQAPSAPIAEAQLATPKGRVMERLIPGALNGIVPDEFLRQELTARFPLRMAFPQLFANNYRDTLPLMLHGPPGAGKLATLKALAWVSGIRLFVVSVPWLTARRSEGERWVRLLFDVVQAEEPSMLYIQEIDAFVDPYADVNGRIKMELLVQLARWRGRVFIVWGTCKPWQLDPAIRRRCGTRFAVGFPPPDASARRALLCSFIEETCPTERGALLIHALAQSQSEEKDLEDVTERHNAVMVKKWLGVGRLSDTLTRGTTPAGSRVCPDCSRTYDPTDLVRWDLDESEVEELQQLMDGFSFGDMVYCVQTAIRGVRTYEPRRVAEVKKTSSSSPSQQDSSTAAAANTGTAAAVGVAAERNCSCSATVGVLKLASFTSIISSIRRQKAATDDAVRYAQWHSDN